MSDFKGQGFLGFEITYFPDGKRASVRFWMGNSLAVIILISLTTALKLPIGAVAKLMGLWK
jgi:hypothetical protein